MTVAQRREAEYRMNPPSTTAEMLVSQFAPAVLLSLKQVSQATGQADESRDGRGRAKRDARAEQTIRNLISQNRTTLPTRKVGGRRVVHVLDLAAWLDEQRVALDDVPLPEVPRRRPGRPTKAEQRRAR